MKVMGKDYQRSTKELIGSYDKTINEINEIHDNFTKKVMSLTKNADKQNQDGIKQTEKSAHEKYLDMKKQAMKIHDDAKSIYETCQTVTSVFTFGLGKGCLGKEMSGPKYKKFMLNTAKLDKSLDPLLKYVGDENEKREERDERDEMREKSGACGNVIHEV